MNTATVLGAVVLIVVMFVLVVTRDMPDSFYDDDEEEPQSEAQPVKKWVPFDCGDRVSHIAK